MSKDPRQLEYFAFEDFRPGIYEQPGVSHPAGAATEENTYRCISVESGALVPAPRRVQTIQRRPNTIAAEEPSASYSRIFISGILANGPVFSGTGDNIPRGVNLNRSELWFGFEWGTEKDPVEAAKDRNRLVTRYYRNSATPLWENIYTLPLEDQNAPAVPKRCTFVRTTANAATPTDLGNPVVVWLFERDTTVGFRYFPDETTPTVNSTVQVDSSAVGPGSGATTTQPPQELIGHQNRLIVFPLNVYGNGDETVYGNTQGFYYTKVNDPTDRETGINFFSNVTGVENPSGYAEFASLTADELLLIKRQGGGIVLRGQITDFQAVTLPNLKSPGFSQCRGTQSPLGFAYCVENGGVWLWQGGDLSTHISKQLKEDFWRPLMEYGPEVAPSSMAQWGTLIVTPNNWIFDTDHQGWCKLWPNRQDADRGNTEAEQMWHWTTDHNDRWCWGTPRDMEWGDDGDTLTDVAWEFDNRFGATNYSWQSHPIGPSQSRQINVREVLITASGRGTITCIVSAKNAEAQTQTIQVDNEFPTSHRVQFDVRGSHVQVRFVATGTEDSSFNAGPFNNLDA
ncbi:MAG: hypothetical protein ACR2NL_05110, partial [Acidimicrobiia bacterium]